MEYGQSHSLPTSVARDKLSQIITLVQDPRSCVILTRHGTPVAAVVSMSELERIWAQQDIEDVISGKRKPSSFRHGRTGATTQHEAAERIQKIQMDRRMEREVLKSAGLVPVPGGELTVAAPAEAPARRWWQVWRR